MKSLKQRWIEAAHCWHWWLLVIILLIFGYLEFG